MKIRNIVLALLTTLLVNAMPLQAAYAQADDAKGQGCSVTYNVEFMADIRKKIKAVGGNVVELEGARALAFQRRVETVLGQQAPFTSNRIILVTPNSDEISGVNVGFFSDNCLKAVMVLPHAVVETFLSPLEKKPGERVD